MKKLLLLIFILSNIISPVVFGQPGETLPEKFLRFLNSYETDSLDAITAKDFSLVENYVHHEFSRKGFLDSFVLFSKAINGKFEILKTISNTRPVKFLVKDQNDYAKYLRPKVLKWFLTIDVRDNQILKMTSDTIKGYKKYLDDFLKKHDSFLDWLSKNYPLENEEALFKNKTGLLSGRLKEYSNR